MGMDASIFCIGPYKEEMVDILDYSREHHLDTKEGAIVTSTLFTCNTDDQSRLLANAFGFDAWDFNKHHIKSIDQMDITAIYELEERCAEWNTSDINILEILLRNGFFALFMPNR